MVKEEWSLACTYLQALRRLSCLCSETGSQLGWKRDDSQPWPQWPFVPTGQQVLGLLHQFPVELPHVWGKVSPPLRGRSSIWEKTKYKILWFIHPWWICVVFYLFSLTNSINLDSLILSLSPKSKVMIYKPYIPHKHGIDCCCPPRVIFASISQPLSHLFVSI